MKPLTIDSKYVGIPFKPVEKTITWRESKNYAAVLHDMLPCYFDDENNRSLLIHPMLFIINLCWSLIANVESYLDIPGGNELFTRLVHYKTNIKYFKMAHTPLTVTIHGQIARMKPHKKSTEIGFCFDYINEAGELLCREYAVTMLRDVTCIGGEKTLPDYPQEQSAPDAAPVFTKAIRIDPSFSYLYDACSDAYNPIHTSHAFAKSVGLPDLVIAGVSTLGLGVKEVIAKEFGENFTFVDSIYARLSGMVFQNNELEIRILDTKKEGNFKEIFFEIFNSSTGKKAVSDGYIKMK